MSDLDRDAIKARAGAADTPGPWETRNEGPGEPWHVVHDSESVIGVGFGRYWAEFSEADAEHIAAFNPKAALALLAALDEAEIRLGAVEYQRNLYRGQIIEMTGRAESAERRIAAVEAEALVWEMSPRGQMAPTRGVGQIIRAALHPVAETTERME